MKNVQEILEVIRRVRKEKSITQQEIADSLNISREMYSNYENGKSKMSLEIFLDIVQFLEIDIMDILNIEANISKETIDEIFNVITTLQNIVKKLM